MPANAFQTHPYYLRNLLEDCHSGALQLPDFQRSWVWDEDRIKALIASISRAFPIGALMTLSTGGEVDFKPRAVEGSPAHNKAQQLLLDGQQRVTSMYQVAHRGQVAQTVTSKNKRVDLWFYLDIRKCLDGSCDREDAVISMPESRIVKEDFNRKTVYDVSTPELEYKSLLYPVSRVFDWDKWQDGFQDYWKDEETRQMFRDFKNTVLENFKTYQIPVITLDRSTTKEAVCVVFEKVNTGGKALDAFELVTATYAAEGHELRKDWLGEDSRGGRHARLSAAGRLSGAKSGILGEVSSTDFLQAIALFHNRERRRAALALGKEGKELPSVTPNRQALLALPLSAYKQYEAKVESGFVRAAKFLYTLHIYRVRDLPYQSQMVPLAAILADLDNEWEHDETRACLSRWYWNGVFGELYGSATESRFARDFLQVPDWLRGGAEPSSITDAVFRADRLKTMRMRLSAAYKGVNALLMRSGAEDFRSGQKFDHTAFFDENVDIHHVFPQDWCKKRKLSPKTYDSIINKTPLTYKTNRIIGGVAPSEYIAKLEKASGKTETEATLRLDAILMSHLINPTLLREDNFEGFFMDRQNQLLALIELAMGKTAHPATEELNVEEQEEEGDDVVYDA